MAATYMDCGSVEQYKAIRKPTCGCAGCWQKWNEKQQREAECSVKPGPQTRVDTGWFE